MKPPLRSAPTSLRSSRGWLALALLASACSCHQKEPAREATPSPTRQLVPAAPEPSPEEATSTEAESAAPAPSPRATEPFAPGKPAPAPATSGAVSPQAASKARERSSVAPERRAGGAAADREADKKGDGAGLPSSLLERLDSAVKLNTPDCPSARERRKSICDLAGQICGLVDRDPNVASVEGYCDDARQRCNEAERRTAERCER